VRSLARNVRFTRHRDSSAQACIRQWREQQSEFATPFPRPASLDDVANRNNAKHVGQLLQSLTNNSCHSSGGVRQMSRVLLLALALLALLASPAFAFRSESEADSRAAAMAPVFSLTEQALNQALHEYDRSNSQARLMMTR